MSLHHINDPDEYDDTFRPSALSAAQRYNLQNQSWGISRKNKHNTLVDPVDQYYDDLNVYPSNSEVVWTGLQFQPVEAGADPYERLYTNLYTDKLGTDTLAAKGYFIIDLLRRGQSRVEAYNANKTKYNEITSPELIIPTDLTTGGATIVQQFAGRVFYAGFSGEVTNKDIRSPNLSNFIAFSQLVRNKKDFSKCYQEGDPTSRDNADLVDTDGGFIKLSGAEKIIAMINLGTYLAIIASNGVWSISGGSDFGFGATNYKSDKISSYGGISTASVVEEGGKAFYWGEDGIYVIAKDQYGALTVASITETTIQTLYQNIPNISKAEVVGTYDSLNKTIRWIYKVGDARFSEETATYELILNTAISAFSRNRIYNPIDNRLEVVSIFSATQFSSLQSVSEVVVDAESVVVGVDSVTSPELSTSDTLRSSRYLVFNYNSGILSFSFAYYNDLQFRDWPHISNGVDAKAFLLTGEITGNASSVPKQAPYLTMHMERTENGVSDALIPENQSGLLIRSQWDFANTINSNKWSSLFQAYRYRKPRFVIDSTDTYDTGFKLITTKNKLRGRGRALSIYMESEPLKDCKIVGWALDLNGNSIT